MLYEVITYLSSAKQRELEAAGRAECVLVVCLDLVSEFVLAGFSALKGLSTTPSRPFDRERDGLSLGEGAAALLLMSEARARREGRPVLVITSYSIHYTKLYDIDPG